MATVLTPKTITNRRFTVHLLLMKHVANLDQTNMSQVADHFTTLLIDDISYWNGVRSEAHMAGQISRNISKHLVETALAQVVLWVAKA